MPPPIINPINFIIEIILTVFIASLAIIIFKKTKSLETISGKKSIKLFRYSFLFFGLAYVFRFLTMTSMIVAFLTELSRSFGAIVKLLIIPLIAFFSLAAILTLISSVIKKVQEKKQTLPIIIVSSFIISIISFLTQSIHILVFAEIVLVVIGLIIIQKQNRSLHRRKKNKFYKLYLLLFLAWLMSVALLIPFRRKIPYEVIIIPLIISAVIFSIIFKKVVKWIK